MEKEVKKQSWLEEVHEGGDGPHWTVVPSNKTKNKWMNERMHGYLLNCITDDYAVFTNTAKYLISAWEEMFNNERGNAIKIYACTCLLLYSWGQHNGDHNECGLPAYLTITLPEVTAIISVNSCYCIQSVLKQTKFLSLKHNLNNKPLWMLPVMTSDCH